MQEGLLNLSHEPSSVSVLALNSCMNDLKPLDQFSVLPQAPEKKCSKAVGKGCNANVTTLCSLRLWCFLDFRAFVADKFGSKLLTP